MASIFVWPDGRVEQFVIGGDSALWHRWTNNAAVLGQWESLGGRLRKFSVATTMSGKPEVFAISLDDNETMHQWIDITWSGWSPLGGKMTDIDVASNNDGRLELFGIGDSKEVFHNWQNADATWSGWSPLGDGGSFTSVQVKRKGNKLLEVFALHDDGSIRHKWQSPPGWSDGWPSLDGNVTSFQAICNSSGFLELFGVFAGGEIKHRWQLDNAWSDGWASLGGNFLSISAGAFPDGTAQVVGSNAKGDIFVNYRSKDGAWSGWKNDSPGEALVAGTGRLALPVNPNIMSPQEKADKAAELRNSCNLDLGEAIAALVAGLASENQVGLVAGVAVAAFEATKAEEVCKRAAAMQSEANASGQVGEAGQSPNEGGMCSAPAGATGKIGPNLDDNSCHDDDGE